MVISPDFDSDQNFPVEHKNNIINYKIFLQEQGGRTYQLTPTNWLQKGTQGKEYKCEVMDGRRGMEAKEYKCAIVAGRRAVNSVIIRGGEGTRTRKRMSSEEQHTRLYRSSGQGLQLSHEAADSEESKLTARATESPC
jgi:hypothetical protein